MDAIRYKCPSRDTLHPHIVSCWWCYSLNFRIWAVVVVVVDSRKFENPRPQDQDNFWLLFFCKLIHKSTLHGFYGPLLVLQSSKRMSRSQEDSFSFSLFCRILDYREIRQNSLWGSDKRLRPMLRIIIQSGLHVTLSHTEAWNRPSKNFWANWIIMLKQKLPVKQFGRKFEISALELMPTTSPILLAGRNR